MTPTFPLKILVVESDFASRRAIVDLITTQGHTVWQTDNGSEGFALFQQHRPDLVITDILSSTTSGTRLLQEIRGIDPVALVVVSASFEGKDEIVQALHLRATNFIHKPLRLEEVLTLLRKYTAITEARCYGAEILHMMSHQQFQMRIDNSIHLVPKITDFLVRATHDILLPQSRMEVRLGLGELIANAIEHGNLEISYEEKTNAMAASDTGLEELFEKRRADPVLGVRRVSISFNQVEGCCEWVIADEGRGFDWHRLPDPLSPDYMMSCHGRGIFLARFQFDQMEYVGAGNRVRLRKNVRPPNGSGKPDDRK